MLTGEQEDLIYSIGNAKGIAVAGSGKSTTLFGYARYHANEKGLYLVYNKSAKMEALAKAKKYGLKKLKIHTAHSLAYSQVGKKYKITTVTPLDQIIEICNITGNNAEVKYTLAQMILDGINLRCNKMEDKLSYSDFVAYDKGTVNKYFEDVELAVEYMWDLMEGGYIRCTHDFYLKLYAMKTPDLKMDYIVFDEGQDANEVMLNIFTNQKSTKVIVGDPSQQIYSWRGAINALNKVNYPSYKLTGCFRFDNSIANEANRVLGWKRLIGTYKDTVLCEGLRTRPAHSGPTAFLCRSTVGLFKKMVEVHVSQNCPIYIEGGLYNNDFLSNSRMLSDIYNLFSNKKAKIKNKMIKGFGDIQALKQFAFNTGNKEINTLIDLVYMYRSQIFTVKKQLVKSIVHEKSQAGAFFSTVHKAKGQEYSQVVMDDTFINHNEVVMLSEAIKKEQAKQGYLSPDMIDRIKQANEEINIRYVAITRAMNSVSYNY